MNPNFDLTGLSRKVATFKPGRQARPRCLAIYAATLALAESELMTLAIERGRQCDIGRSEFYEVVLQSYLFLGFPRMLSAAEHLESVLPNGTKGSQAPPPADDDIARWRRRGAELCRRIYGETFPLLKDKVQPIAPEIFDWMIFEGYGKVLSRPGLDMISRELCIVAFLMVENRPVQLHSHMRGALNVGADLDLLRTVIDDLGEANGDGYRAAQEILSRF